MRNKIAVLLNSIGNYPKIADMGFGKRMWMVIQPKLNAAGLLTDRPTTFEAKL